MSVTEPPVPPSPAPEAPPAPPPAAPAPAPAPDPAAPQPTPPPAPEPIPPPVPLGPPAADPVQVEFLIAAVGIEPFVGRSLRRVWLYHMDRAAKVGDEIDRKLYAFLGSTEPAPSRDLPAWDFETVREQLDTTPTPQHTTDIIEAFGELSDAGLAAVQKYESIQRYLVTKIPRRIHQSIAGPVQEMPPHSDVARFRRTWNVACDPLSLLDDLNEYALSRDMVQAAVDMYPLLFKRIQDGVNSQLARKKTVTPKFRLSIRKEQQLRILIQEEDVTSKAMGVALQAQFAAMAAEAAPKPAKAPAKTSGAEASAADRIGSG